jgi:hypothetical protein
VPTSAAGERNVARMPLQLIKDGRLVEWIGKTTIFCADQFAVIAISRPICYLRSQPQRQLSI